MDQHLVRNAENSQDRAAETTKAIMEDHSHRERKINKVTGKKKDCVPKIKFGVTRTMTEINYMI